jgi:hypothetical protein
MILYADSYLILDKNTTVIETVKTENDHNITYIVGVNNQWICVYYDELKTFVFYEINTYTTIGTIPICLEAFQFNNCIHIDSKVTKNQFVSIFFIFHTHVYIQYIEFNGKQWNTYYELFNYPNELKTILHNPNDTFIHISLCKYTNWICYLINSNNTVYLYNPYTSQIIKKVIHPYLNNSIQDILLHKSSLYLQTSEWIVEYNLDENSILIPKLIVKGEHIYEFFINEYFLYVCVQRKFPRNKSNTMYGMLLYDSKSMKLINNYCFNKKTQLTSMLVF